MSRTVRVALADYGRRARFPIVLTLSLFVLMPGMIGLIGGEDWAPEVCFAFGTLALIVGAGMVSGHLKEVLARPQTRLLPGYPPSQVIAGALLVLPVALLHFLFGFKLGLGLLGALAATGVIASTYWAAPFLFARALLFITLGPSIIWWLTLLNRQEDLAGRLSGLGLSPLQPGWKVAAIVWSVALTTVVVFRMLHLTESSPEYRADPSMSWKKGARPDVDAPFIGFFNRIVPWFGRYHVEGLSSRYGAGLWSRVQLWRMGMSPTSPMVTGISLGGIVLIVGAFFRIYDENKEPAEAALLVFYLLVFPSGRATFFHRRRERIAYEALYPASREQMLKELGATSVVDTLETWFFLCLGTLVVHQLGLFSKISLSGLFSYIVFSLGVAALGIGLLPWVLRLQGDRMASFVLTTTVIVIAAPVAGILATGPGSEATGFWALAALGLAALGAFFGYRGYRAWMGLELGRVDIGER